MIHVERQLHIGAPEGDAVYARACYTRAGGEELLEAVRHEAMRVKADGSKHYYERRIYLRRSQDNGRSWSAGPDEQKKDGEHLEGSHSYPPTVILDERNDLLIALQCTYEVDPAETQFSMGSLPQRTRRMFYRLSDDGGRTWTESRQIIHASPNMNPTNWAPGISYGTTGGIASGQPVFMPDGTLVIAFVISHPQAPHEPAGSYYMSTIYAQTCLVGDGLSLGWKFGREITVPYPASMIGCCEPALCSLGGNRLFNTMRCQGDEKSGIYAIRHTTVSNDGGLTWSEPTPLVYDDGETVWTPASVHRFFPSSKTGKTYLLANILPAPVHAQTPRYPLTIAEFDTERCCVLRDTVEVIQDLPEGAPTERRYTNWGQYEERGTGDLILTLPEQPKHMDFSAMTRPEQYTADCIRFRIRLD